MSSAEASLSSELSKLSLQTEPASPARSTQELTASPPGTPTRPKRNPLRAQSQTSLRDAAKQQDQGLLTAEIRLLGLEISRLHDRIYEIQELRHSSSAPTERLNTLLSTLTTQVASLTPRMVAVLAAEGPNPRLDDIRGEWDKLLKAQKVLGEEMKEDGWLIRFRTTAEQAEAMMDHLQKSQTDLFSYLDRISASPYEVPHDAEDGGLSLSDMLKLNKAHESMRSTYVPSINKILKMMDRSLSDRTTKNGESLRRFGDMEIRWKGLQRSLAQLDARVRLMLSQHGLSEEHVEILDDGIECFPIPRKSRSGSSPGSQPSAFVPSPSHSTAGSLRRRPSGTSIHSATTTRPEKPRWNISTKIDQSAKSKRASFGYTGVGHISPTSSVGSRIPIPVTPRRAGQGEPTTPTPVQPSHYRAPHTTSRISQSHTSTASLVSASAPRLRRTGPPSSYRPTTPSAFAPPLSRPSSRQSMNDSVLGHRLLASSVRGPAQDLKPFRPSKYDDLDQAVAAIMTEEGFDLFVSRVDPPLGRGQRRAEGEEWKGEYVFGAGEKSSSVKLLTLAGAKLGNAGGIRRTKCLVRTQGMWVGLADLLRERKGRHGDVF